MANRLSTTNIPKPPKTWFVECAYCNPPSSHPNTPIRLHETELLAMAKKLCRNHATNHYLDYVNAELDTLDHSILTPITMIEILTQIHNSLPCSCLSDTTATIEDLTRNTHNVTIPKAYAIPATPPTTPQKPKPATPTKPKTLLERLKNGQNGRQQHP